MFNEQLNGCVPISTENTNGLIQTECPEGTTYDPQLGYCVQDQCGCPLGTYMNPDTNECVPYGDTGEQDGCWTYEVSVPECPDITPTPHPECDRDEKWNPVTMKCERLPDEEIPMTCADYTNSTACTAAGCNWYPYSSPPCYP
jgi:hypothetical protein